MILAKWPAGCFVINDLLPVNRKRQSGSLLNLASALVLTALILLLSAAGASPTLHELIHADSHAVDHNCAITLFAKGHISSAPAAPVCDCFIIRFLQESPVENVLRTSVSDLRLSPGRAPPVC
jgi:hypothetical protein